MNIISIILGIVALGLVALIHEVGHFIMARRAKIDVDELSIGVGPKLFSFKKQNTQYSLRLLPFFAYVKVAEEGERGLNTVSVGSRFLLYIGGVLFNLILGVLIFVILGATSGFVTDKVIVGEVSSGMPAYEAGLEQGDYITYVNGVKVENPTHFSQLVNESNGNQQTYEVSRDGSTLNVQVTPELNQESKSYRIGIVFGKEKMTLFDSIGFAFKTTATMVAGILDGLFKMVTGSNEVEVSGPVGIVNMATQFTQHVQDYFLFIAVLSISMGVFNLLPIPALDGGKIVFLGIEKIRGKKVNERIENYLTLIGFGLLILLLIYATFKDVTRLFGE